MRRVGTSLVVLAVAGLALAAAVDALRGTDSASPPAPNPAITLARQPETAIRHLREAGVTGVLTYSDEGCRLHAVALPELAPVRAPPFEACRVPSASGGIGAYRGDVVWAGLGYGTMQVVLPKERLNALLGREGLRVRQALSLGEERYAVVSGRENEAIVSIHEGDDRVFRAATVFGDEGVFVRASPRGGYVGVLVPGRPSAQVADRDGRSVPLPRVTAPHAIAWSPDERWTALATEEFVYVFRTERPDGSVVRIPLAVRDLDWGE